MNPLALLVALFLGFHASDCVSGHIDTYFEDQSYTILSDSRSVTCVETFHLLDGSQVQHVQSIRLLSETLYHHEDIIYSSGQPFPESVIWFDGYGTLKDGKV